MLLSPILRRAAVSLWMVALVSSLAPSLLPLQSLGLEDLQLVEADLETDATRTLSLQGMVLVAAPGLQDPYFAGTRIYLLQHDGDGAVGVVLNKSHPSGRVSEGGPVGLHTVLALVDEHAAPADSVRIADGVSVLTDPTQLEDEIVLAHARVFVGYSGWGPGQLESEIQGGAWLLRRGSAADALDLPAGGYDGEREADADHDSDSDQHHGCDH